MSSASGNGLLAHGARLCLGQGMRSASGNGVGVARGVAWIPACAGRQCERHCRGSGLLGSWRCLDHDMSNASGNGLCWRAALLGPRHEPGAKASGTVR